MALPPSLDLGRLRDAAEESERGFLVNELLESMTVCPDHLEVVVSGSR